MVTKWLASHCTLCLDRLTVDETQLGVNLDTQNQFKAEPTRVYDAIGLDLRASMEHRDFRLGFKCTATVV